MIKVYAPGATSLQMTTFFTGKGLRANYWLATMGTLLTPGFIIEFDEPNESWPTLKQTVAALAVAIGVTRIRVLFDEFDPSLTSGRLAARSFWVASDRAQTEL